MSESATLEVREVSAGYGAVPVLRGVTITAQAGTITAVLGANGAGKTTLLRVIDGSIKPSQGQIWLDGANLAGRRPENVSRAGIAHVPEGQGVITELTVAENLQLGLLLRPRSERSAALADIYNRFSVLADRRSKAAGTLSGGERQMLVIARALATDPRVLLLDEPSLGLAPKIVRDVLDLISQLKTDTGLTIILVEQNARSALAIADLGIVLNLGSVVATAPAGQLAADEALRRHYLGF
ncbi:MAG TPA: ABC transporter ATP-binding protein [Streptosporangiaceae bacterium]|jgi:branched-chain amino acid transport system ATP-binding protein